MGSPFFTMAEITSVHGVKGYLKVKSYADSSSVYKPGAGIYIGTSETDCKRYDLLKATPHKKGLLMLFEGVDRNRAEELIGQLIFMDRDSLPAVDEDEWYWDDLVGIDVEDVNRGFLGRVDHVFETGSNDVIVVKDGKEEVLVPVLDWVIKSVDLESGTMLVEMPEGL